MPGSAPTACAGSSQGGPRDRRGAVTRRSAAGKAVQAADALNAWLTGHSGAGPEPAENSPAPGVDPGGPATTAAPRAAASPGTRPVPDHTDWLLHRLAVDGPEAELAALREAACGAGLVPWELDLDVLEEDWLHRLLAPAGRTLSLSGARVLAGQLRDAVERRHALAHARVGRSRACPFDLHALLPVPGRTYSGSVPTTLTRSAGCGGTGAPRRRCGTCRGSGGGRARRLAARQRPGRRCLSFWAGGLDAVARRSRRCAAPGRRCGSWCGRLRPGVMPSDLTLPRPCPAKPMPGRRRRRPADRTRRAGAGGRRVRGAARLAAGAGPGPADRPGAAVDPGLGRRLRRRAGGGAGRAAGGRAAAGRWGDWLVMAATLALLRSRLLLPADARRGGRPLGRGRSAAPAVLDRAADAAAAAWLERRPQLGRDVFGRGAGDRPANAAARVGDVTDAVPGVPGRAAGAGRCRGDLPAAAAAMDDAAGGGADPGPAAGLRGAGRAFEAFLPRLPRDAADRPLRCRAAVAGTFAATLELARDGTLRLEQEGAGLVAYAASPAAEEFLSSTRHAGRATGPGSASSSMIGQSGRWSPLQASARCAQRPAHGLQLRRLGLQRGDMRERQPLHVGAGPCLSRHSASSSPHLRHRRSRGRGRGG